MGRPRKYARVMVPCAVCGQPFERIESPGNRQFLCGRACLAEWGRRPENREASARRARGRKTSAATRRLQSERKKGVVFAAEHMAKLHAGRQRMLSDPVKMAARREKVRQTWANKHGKRMSGESGGEL